MKLPRQVEWITIKEKAHTDGHHLFYLCECECGKEFKSRLDAIPKILKGGTKNFNCIECFSRHVDAPAGEWGWVDGYKGKYAVYTDGRVWSARYNKFLKASTNCPDGSPTVKLGGDGPYVSVHRLVAERFIPNTDPKDKPFVKFKDGDKFNPHVSNLEWTGRETAKLEGRVFNRLEVLEWARAENSKFYWLCRCVCGNTVSVSTTELETGHTKSCGCLAREMTAERNRNKGTHKMSTTPEYRVWYGMKNRCENEDAIGYESYGGRGISVAPRWSASFEEFLKDMGHRPSDKHTIERVDVNKGYCPENCIWTHDRSLQEFNQRKRRTNTSGRTGVYEYKAGKWEVMICGKRIFRTEDFDLACFVREEAELSKYGFSKE